MLDREIAIDQTEQDRAKAVARVEADPGSPHACLGSDSKVDPLHCLNDRWLSREKLGAFVRENEMADSQ